VRASKLRTRRRAIEIGLSVLVLVIFAGCSLVPAAIPEETFCDGISSEVGGCAPDRPSFAATTCDEIAREFGSQVNQRLVAIYNGPEERELSKAVRATQYLTVAASLANLRVRNLGLIKECAAGPFVDVAETEFSDDLRAHAGEIMTDGDPVSYDVWRDELLNLMALLDLEEDAPAS